MESGISEAGDFSRYILVSFQRSKKTSNGFFGFQSMNFLALIIQDSSFVSMYRISLFQVFATINYYS